MGAPAFNVVIDGAAPAVAAINRISPSAASSSASEVTCRALFSEAVAGVDQTDFTLAFGAGLTGAIASVRPAGPSAFDVVIGPLSGEGAVHLGLSAAGTGIADLAGNPLPGGFPAVQIFTRALLGDGVWARTTSGGLWSDNANWVGGVVAHGAGVTADFSAIEIPEDIVAHLDAPRAVTNLIFGDDDMTSPASWMIDDSGDATNTLTLVSGAAPPNITVNPLGSGSLVRIAAPLWIFGALGLLVSTIGLYGLTAYAVVIRTREIGIRTALGAQRKDIVRLMVKEAAIISFVGIAVGLSVALAVTRLLSSLLYGISSTVPVTYAAVSVFVALVVVTAFYIPARRAAKINALDALRYE